MKRLRVLTGQHAGARVRLHAGCWRVSRTSRADTEDTGGMEDAATTARAGSLELDDWAGPPLSIDVGIDASGAVRVTGPAGEPWADFEPRRHGDVVLCVGPVDAPWPTDLALIQRLDHVLAQGRRGSPTGAGDAGGGRGDAWSRALGVLAAGGLLALVAAGPSQPHAGLPWTSGTDPVRPPHAASPAHGGRDGATARPPGVGSDVALDQFRSALRASGADVRATTPGNFVIDGVVADVGRVRSLSEQLARDLGPAVRSVDLRVRLATAAVPTSARLHAGSTRYAVRADGTKDFLPAGEAGK